VNLASVTDRRTMALVLMAAPLTAGGAARADEADTKATALALAEHARLLYRLLAMELVVTGFWHLQSHVLLDAAGAGSDRDLTADLDSLRAATARLREAKTEFQNAIGQAAGITPLRRIQLKNVQGTMQHVTDDTDGIVEYLAHADVGAALALHRERSVPLFESLQRDVHVAAKAIATDVVALAESI
jgi:hypothetical protein